MKKYILIFLFILSCQKDDSSDIIDLLESRIDVSTFTGSGLNGSEDGLGTSASFSFPRGIAIDTLGNLYVADSNNRKIRKIDSSGNVSTFAGSGINGSSEGQGTEAKFG